MRTAIGKRCPRCGADDWYVTTTCSNKCAPCKKEYAHRSARHLAPEAKKKRHAYLLRTRYGLSSEEYEALLRAQEGLCALCKQCESRDRRLSVDHDHENGKVRGLLCDDCNKGLGLLGDSTERLSIALAYLKASS